VAGHGDSICRLGSDGDAGQSRDQPAEEQHELRNRVLRLHSFRHSRHSLRFRTGLLAALYNLMKDLHYLLRTAYKRRKAAHPTEVSVPDQHA
jgi:hypothetical protein